MPVHMSLNWGGIDSIEMLMLLFHLLAERQMVFLVFLPRLMAEKQVFNISSPLFLLTVKEFLLIQLVLYHSIIILGNFCMTLILSLTGI